MISFRVTFDLLEQELFSTLETVSWADTISCLFAYFFVFFVLTVTLFAPLVLFAMIFLFR